MEDLQEASTVPHEPGLSKPQLLTVIDQLAEFQSFYLNSKPLKQLLENNLIINSTSKSVVDTFQKQFFENYLKSLSFSHSSFNLSTWLDENLSQYFNLIGSCPYQTLCHGDLTNNNLMLKGDEVYFIDW